MSQADDIVGKLEILQLAKGTLSKVFECNDRVLAFDVDSATFTLAIASLHKAAIYNPQKALTSRGSQEWRETTVYESSAAIEKIALVGLGPALSVVIGMIHLHHIVATQDGLMVIITLLILAYSCFISLFVTLNLPRLMAQWDLHSGVMAEEVWINAMKNCR